MTKKLYGSTSLEELETKIVGYAKTLKSVDDFEDLPIQLRLSVSKDIFGELYFPETSEQVVKSIKERVKGLIVDEQGSELLAEINNVKMELGSFLIDRKSTEPLESWEQEALTEIAFTIFYVFEDELDLDPATEKFMEALEAKFKEIHGLEESGEIENFGVYFMNVLGAFMETLAEQTSEWKEDGESKEEDSNIEDSVETAEFESFTDFLNRQLGLTSEKPSVDSKKDLHELLKSQVKETSTSTDIPDNFFINLEGLEDIDDLGDLDFDTEDLEQNSMEQVLAKFLGFVQDSSKNVKHHVRENAPVVKQKVQDTVEEVKPLLNKAYLKLSENPVVKESGQKLSDLFHTTVSKVDEYPVKEDFQSKLDKITKEFQLAKESYKQAKEQLAKEESAKDDENLINAEREEVAMIFGKILQMSECSDEELLHLISYVTQNGKQTGTNVFDYSGWIVAFSFGLGKPDWSSVDFEELSHIITGGIPKVTVQQTTLPMSYLVGLKK